MLAPYPEPLLRSAKLPEETTFNANYDEFLEMLKKDKDSPELDDGWKLAKQLWTTTEELAKIREAYFTLEKAQNSLLHEVVTDRVRGPKVLQYMIKNARAIGAEPMGFATMWRPDSEGSEDGSDGGNEGSWEDYMSVKVKSGSCGTSDSGTDSDYIDEEEADEGVKNKVEDGAEKQVEKQVENEQQASITKAKTVEAEITDKPDPAEKEDGALSDIQGVSEVKLLEIEIHARLDKMDQDMANCLKTLSTVAGINKQDEQDDKQGTAEGRVKPRTSEIDKDHVKWAWYEKPFHEGGVRAAQNRELRAENPSRPPQPMDAIRSATNAWYDLQKDTIDLHRSLIRMDPITHMHRCTLPIVPYPLGTILNNPIFSYAPQGPHEQ